MMSDTLISAEILPSSPTIKFAQSLLTGGLRSESVGAADDGDSAADSDADADVDGG